MSSSSRLVEVSRCRRPIGCGGAPGSVMSTRSASRRALQLLGTQLGGARLDHLLERLASLVGRPADLGALGGLELGDSAQQLR